MSNHGGRRAHYDRTVRFSGPPPVPSIRESFPQRARKYRIPSTYPFNPGPSFTAVLKKFGSPISRQPAPPLKVDKAPQQLPIYDKKKEIMDLARNHRLGVIVAKTGSGKTTLVPQFIHEAGFNVTVVSPRRLAASEVAQFGAELRKEPVGESIGFKHGLDKSTSSKTKIVYATEGYELWRQIHNPLPENEWLILDEAHERTAAGCLLLAFYRMREAQGLPIPRILIMSATLAVDKLLAGLGDVPVITVEGRQYEVTELPKGPSPEADVLRFLQEGRNPLSFHYGKKDIEEHINELKEKAPPGSAIYSLHSKLPRRKQKEALEPRDNKAIAATNAAQTSLTIPGVGAVVITGKVRRLQLDKEGVRSLIIDDIAQDEFIQQWGRTGRQQPGVFVSHAKPFSELEPYAPAEIQNAPLESLILRFEAARIPFTRVCPFLFDRPPQAHIDLGYKTLQDLGLCGPQRHQTDTGRAAAQLPVDARMSKLLVRAREYKEATGQDILDDAIRIAAIVEAEGILSGDSRNWQRLAPGRYASDLIRQANVYHRALTLPTDQLETFGIEEVNFERARDIELMIRRRMKLPEQAPPFILPEKSARRADAYAEEHHRPEKMKYLCFAIIEAYIDSVFRLTYRNEAGDYVYKPIHGGRSAILQKGSAVGGANLIVGTRLNIGYLDEDKNQKIQPLILNAHEIKHIDDLGWLEERTPAHLQASLKEGLSAVHHDSNRRHDSGKKKDNMRSKDLRKGKSYQGGKHNHGKGTY